VINDEYATAVGRIREFAEEHMERTGAPGLQVALTDRAGLIAHFELGHANIDSCEPVRPETMFEFGSIGKSFTAICFLQLMEQGRVDVHAPITEYLPWFFVQSIFEPITIHHLLTHTAGIVCGTDFTPGQEFEVWSLRNTVTGTRPGTFFHYSNVGYKALGLALERIERKSYAEIVRGRILEPLGMTNSGGVIDALIRPRLAVGYQPEFDDRPRLRGHRNVPAPWLETNTADGCLVANASDLATYLRMLLNRGAYPGGQLISEESFGMMSTSHIDTGDGGGYGYGYGLAVPIDPPSGAFGHTGGMVGYVSARDGDLDTGFGAVALTNSMNGVSPITLFALRVLNACARGEEIPAIPAPQPIVPSDYAGVYYGPSETIEFVAHDNTLRVRRNGTMSEMEPSLPYADRFVNDSPEERAFPYRFERNADEAITGVVHGPDRWTRDAGEQDNTEVAPEYQAYVGHYRSYNPWQSNFRVVIRDGSLILIWPQGTEDELVPTGSGFRLGADPRIPERLWFYTIVDGNALQARDSLGSTYHRFFTP
jgi:CubicO group peptidase (beta-lactamase class C family)